MPVAPHREPPYHLARWVQRTLPWVAVSATVAGVLITTLSGVPERLPGHALSSTPLFLVERGATVIAALIVVTTLVGRTLGRQLPTGLSTPTGSITYAQTLAEAASSPNATLEASLEEHEIVLRRHDKKITELGDLVATLLATESSPKREEPADR
jgi:hypothetical protein